MARRIVVKKEDRHANRFNTPLPEGVSISKTNISRDPEQGLIVEILYTEEGVAQMLCFTLTDESAMYGQFVGMGYKIMEAARAVLTDYLTTRQIITLVKVVHLREGRPGFDESGKVTTDVDIRKYRCRACGCLWRSNPPQKEHQPYCATQRKGSLPSTGRCDCGAEGSWSLWDGEQKSCQRCDNSPEFINLIEPVYK